MPAAVWPSFHCRPSTTNTLFLPSLSMRQTPTTLTNDFGSAPTVSSEKSTFRGCPALAYVSRAASPTAATAIVALRLLDFISDLHFSRVGRGFAAGDGSTTMRQRSAAATRPRTRRAQAIRRRAADNPDSPDHGSAPEWAVRRARKRAAELRDGWLSGSCPTGRRTNTQPRRKLPRSCCRPCFARSWRGGPRRGASPARAWPARCGADRRSADPPEQGEP